MNGSHKQASAVTTHSADGLRGFGGSNGRGALILNADDWGRDCETTRRTFECIQAGTVSSVSAMVFMEDSERAAAIALEHGVDAGLHLNFTTPFSTARLRPQLLEHQARIAGYLRRHRLAQVSFHPGLVNSFEYCVKAQRDEFQRLHGTAAQRIDGHHHMHLCANVVFGRLLPPRTIVRRNFSFEAGEKGFLNRYYRKTVDWVLARRHRIADYFFSLVPLEPDRRLRRIFELAKVFTVEVETHPINPKEHEFLMGGEILHHISGLAIASQYAVSDRAAN